MNTPDSASRSGSHSGSTPATSSHAATLEALSAVEAHDKPLAVRRIDAIERTLGGGYHPARIPLRAAQCSVDISRWDLTQMWLQELLLALDTPTHP